ncbi:MAG: efflux RND transporter periplasmic adaptor subunit [Hyphomicrobiales bacterium]|nr:efflux RND transporter periplasmic adaptor subunit [Hyphomicrobiales bacterium]
MWKAFAALVIAGCFAAGGYAIQTRYGAEKPEAKAPPAPGVIVEAATRRELLDLIEAVGTTYAKDQIVVTAPVTDPIVALRYSDGQKVKRGDILVELDTRTLAAQLESARATLTEAEKQLERIQTLAARGAGTETRLNEQERARNTAKAEVERMLAEIDRRIIRAPFDGVLGLKRISVGALVQPGTELATLQDISVLKLDFAVPELYMASLKPGQEIIGRSPVYPDREFKGAVSAVEGVVDPVTRAVTVRALLPNDDGQLAPGMLLTVAVVRERAKPIMAPEEAVIALGEERFVFKVEGGDTARRIAVKTGRRMPGYIEIVEGLNEGDVIVADGVIRVRDGGKVRPQSRTGNGGGA